MKGQIPCLFFSLIRLFLPAIIILQSGCLETSKITPKIKANNLKLLGAATWSNVAFSSLPEASGHLGEVLTTAEASASPKRLVSAAADGNVILWDITTGSGRLMKQTGGPMQNAALGRRRALVAWSSGFTISVACATGCSEIWELKRLKTRVTSLAFHEDDTALIIGGADGRVYRWHFQLEREADTQEERDRTLERYIAHQTVVSVVAPLHTGRAFFSADWDGRLYAWLAYTADDQQGSFDKNLFGGRFFGGLGTYMAAPRVADRGITSLAVSDNGQRLAVGTDEGYVEVWEVRGFEMIARTLVHNGRVVSVALNQDGTRVASHGRDGKIAVADLSNDPDFGIKIGSLRSLTAPVLSEEMKSARGIYFLSDGNLIISTNTGQIGELKLSNKPHVAAPLQNVTKQPGSVAQEKGSDY
jgi:WD40 repeat protein